MRLINKDKYTPFLTFLQTCFYSHLCDEISDGMLPNALKFLKKILSKSCSNGNKVALKIHVLLCHQVGGYQGLYIKLTCWKTQH